VAMAVAVAAAARLLQAPVRSRVALRGPRYTTPGPTP
jgi:hypothetical protein